MRLKLKGYKLKSLIVVIIVIVTYCNEINVYSDTTVFYPIIIEESTSSDDVNEQNSKEVKLKGKTINYVVGWIKINNNWFFKDSKGDYVTHWNYINDKWYYFNMNGVMQVGWQFINNNWYYLSESGSMVDGWQYVNKTWYFFNSFGQMQIGWQYINNEWYYFSESGSMSKNWQFINGKWYYFSQKGYMNVGWEFIGNQWYYLSSFGFMEIGWCKVDGNWYYFNASGQLISNHISSFFSKIINDVNDVSFKNKLFPSVMMAQAALESGYGTSKLAGEANNYFGIKFKINEDEKKYDLYYIETKEYDSKNDKWFTFKEPFRKYQTINQSFSDNALKLRQGVSWDKNYYKGTWRENANDYFSATASLQGKYATDPNYSTKLNNLIQVWRLNQFD